MPTAGRPIGLEKASLASNSRLWSTGFSLSVPLPIFNPEKYLMLAQNKLAFPQLQFHPGTIQRASP
jgi:hypothetical protein